MVFQSGVCAFGILETVDWRSEGRSGHLGCPPRAPVQCSAWTFFAFYLSWHILAGAQCGEQVMKDYDPDHRV